MFLLVLAVLDLLQMLRELLDTDIGTGDETNHAEQYQEDVLPEDPVEAPVARFLVEGDQFDNGREHHAEGAEADGPDQRDEGTDVGQGGGDDHGDGLEGGRRKGGSGISYLGIMFAGTLSIAIHEMIRNVLSEEHNVPKTE